MNWYNLKKPYLANKPAPAQNFCSRTEERDLEIIYNKLQHLEEVSKKLYKEVKKYEESVNGLQKLETKITSELSGSALCHQDPELRKLSEEYYSVVCQMNETTQQLVKIAHRTVVEPIKKFNAEFAAIGTAVKKRDQALQECVKLQMKLEKLQDKEKTGSTVVKVEQMKKSLVQAKEEFQLLNNQLLQELPLFYDKRVDYFQPSLQSLIQAQMDYYGESTKLFTHLVTTCGKTTVTSETDFQKQIQSDLKAIKALSIVAD